jgi:hypothetical protein
MSAQLPLQYAGRYVESYKQSLACRHAAVSALQSANRKMYDAEAAEHAAVKYLEHCRNGTADDAASLTGHSSANGVHQAASGLMNAASSVATVTANKLASVATNVAGAAVASISSVASAATPTVAASSTTAAAPLAVASARDDEGVDDEEYQGGGWEANTDSSPRAAIGLPIQRRSESAESFDMIEDEDCWGQPEQQNGESEAAAASVSPSVRAYGQGSSGLGRVAAVEQATEAVNAAKQNMFMREEAFERAKTAVEQISVTIRDESGHVAAVTKKHAEVKRALRLHIWHSSHCL